MIQLGKLIGRHVPKVVTGPVQSKAAQFISKYGLVVATNVATALGTVVVLTIGKRSIQDLSAKVINTIEKGQSSLDTAAKAVKAKVKAVSQIPEITEKQFQEMLKGIILGLETKFSEKFPNGEEGLTDAEKAQYVTFSATIMALHKVKTPLDLLPLIRRVQSLESSTVSTAFSEVVADMNSQEANPANLKNALGSLQAAWEKNFQETGNTKS